MSMGDRLRDKQQQARDIPDGHCPAESASKEPKGSCLSREIELPNDRIYEGRHCEFGADQKANAQDCCNIQNVHDALLDFRRPTDVC
jgi:hypothetical protein